MFLCFHPVLVAGFLGVGSLGWGATAAWGALPGAPVHGPTTPGRPSPAPQPRRSRVHPVLEQVAALAREPHLTVARVEAVLGVRLDPEEGCAGPILGYSTLPASGPFTHVQLNLPRDPARAADEALDLRLREVVAPDGEALVSRFGEPITQRPASPSLRRATGVAVVITYPLWHWEAAFGLGPPPGDRLRTVSLRREVAR